MRAKSDLTDQSECGLPYSVFGELAVKLVFTEAADQAQLVIALNVSFYFDHLTITMHYNLLRKEPCTFFVHICLFVGWHLTSYTPSSTPQLLVSESAPLRDKWLLISRKKRNTDEENARDLTEWVGRAGPTGGDTVANSRKNTR